MHTTEPEPPAVETRADGKPSRSRKLVGQPIRRVEDARLLAGLGRYVDDRPAPDALHVAIRRSD